MNNDLQIIKEPELYIPEFINGIYSNHIPTDLNSGYKCGCGSRKNHIFNNTGQNLVKSRKSIKID